jgi:hypothetical protein
MKFPIPDLFQSFTWSNPSPPLSSLLWPSIIVPLYLIVIYTIQWHVKTHRHNKPYNVNFLFAYHNLLMSILSLIMFIGCLIEVVRRTVNESSLYWAVCEPRHNPSSGGLYFWSYLYYLSKYYELFDTVFLALKGKLDGWGGLNVYHHSVVVFMAWWWLEYGMSLQFYGLLFNTSVHVIMYYYFYLRSVGQVPKWRAFITKYQITQFVTSCSLLPVNWVFHFGLSEGGCNGEVSLLLNLVFNLTLLSEFFAIHKASERGQGKAKVVSTGAVGEGKKVE